MGYGLTNHLLALSGLIFLCSAVIASRRLPVLYALPLAFIRSFLPLLYFAWYFDGQWTFLDDVTYFEHGEYLLSRGFSPLCIFTEEGRNAIHMLSGSSHILYSWWNLFTMWLAGVYYYVPVLLNVLLTFGSAHLFAQLLEEIGFSVPYQRTMQVCYLLHWDTIAWSSVANVKDPIVQLLTIGLFLCAVQFVRYRSWTKLASCCGIALVFGFLRFYVPFVVGSAAAAWVFLQWRDFRKFPLLAGGSLVGLWLLPGGILQFFDTYSPFDIAYGICRFALTPQPWNVADSYSFLLLPATFHWLMILPAFVGGVMLWRDSQAARFVLLYGMAIIAMYALAEEIQGVRQRAQVSFVFAWMQVHFLWRWIHTPASQTATAPMQSLRRVPMRAAQPTAPAGFEIIQPAATALPNHS